MHPFIYDLNRITPLSLISKFLCPKCTTKGRIILKTFPSPLPLDRTLHIHNVPQFASQFHDPTAYHARINRHGLLDEFLGGGRGVEAHDEVVAAVMAGLILLDGAGEKEGPPVRNAADYAALSEDEGTSCAGNP